MKIRNKLLLILIIPIISLLYFSISIISEKSSILREMNSLQDLANLSVSLSSLVHELQKERGASAGFLGSKGKKFITELQAQRLKTDIKIKELKTFLKDFDHDESKDEYDRTLHSALESLDMIESEREAISSLRMSTADDIKYYSDINTSFMQTIFQTSKLSTNAKISNILTAYFNFLQAKEKAGIERAVLNITFARNRFTRSFFDKFRTLLTAQNIYTKVFLTMASPEQIDFFKNKMHGHFVDEVERMRKIAFKRRNTSHFGVEPAYWFKMATGRINLLKEVEDYLSNDLKTNVAELKNKAQLTLIVYSVITSMVILITIFLPYFVTLGIATPWEITESQDQFTDKKTSKFLRAIMPESPVRFLVITTLSIFAAEIFVMYILSYLPPFHIAIEALLDATLLIVMVSPALYFFLFQPLVLQITGRKLAQEHIYLLNVELEQRILDRTSQLEVSNNELEAFTYSVSHDLRAPLRHISGFATLLENKASSLLDDKNQRYLRNIIDSVKDMGKLIDDLLAFSRVGRYELSKSRVSLKKLVEKAKEELKPEMQGRNIVWEISELPEIEGDPSMLRQVVINLISNALKYTRPRTQARIEIGCNSDENNETVFFIRDNGVGFDMQYVDKLFGVFKRLHSEKEFEGTGIGLAIVRRIIHRHGGKTWAEGSVDGGATFYFSIPNL